MTAANTSPRLFEIAPIGVPDGMALDAKGTGVQWRWVAGQHYQRTVAPTMATLETFTRLQEATAAEIRSFVADWGIPARQGRASGNVASSDTYLLLRCHPNLLIESLDYGDLTPEQRQDHRSWWWLSLGDLRAAASQTRALLLIIARLREKQPGHADDWRTVLPDVGVVPHNVKHERALVAKILNVWLAGDGAVPEMAWDRPAVRLVLRPQGLLGALAALLLNASEAAVGFVLCASCGRPHLPRKYSGPERQHYCAECGKRASVRDASRRLRERRRAGTASDPPHQT